MQKRILSSLSIDRLESGTSVVRLNPMLVRRDALGENLEEVVRLGISPIVPF